MTSSSLLLSGNQEARWARKSRLGCHTVLQRAGTSFKHRLWMPSPCSLSKGALSLLRDKLENQTYEVHFSVIIILITAHLPYWIMLINYAVSVSSLLEFSKLHEQSMAKVWVLELVAAFIPWAGVVLYCPCFLFPFLLHSSQGRFFQNSCFVKKEKLSNLRILWGNFAFFSFTLPLQYE